MGVDEVGAPRRPPSLRRRMTLALSAWILAAGVLAAGASALTGSEDAAAGAKAAKLDANGVPFKRDGRECRGGHEGGERSPSAYSPSDF